MAANLIDLAKGYLTTEVMHKIAGALGESPERIEQAVEAGIPSILAGFLNAVSSGGANRLFDTLKREPAELSHLGGLDGVFGNLGSLLSGSSMDGLIKYGQSLLTSLFGGRLNSVVDLIAKSSGLKVGSATSLLGMLTPLIAGLLRKETAARGASAASLTNLLMDQKDAIARLAPTGLSHALGVQSLADLGSSVSDSVKSAAQDFGRTTSAAARDFGRTASSAAREGTEWLRWAVPLALLALLLLGLYSWFGVPQQPAPNPEQPPAVARTEPNPGRPPEVVRATPPASDTVAEKVDRAAQAARDTGKRLTEDGKALVETARRKIALALPGDVKIDVPENSYLQAMVRSFTDSAGPGDPKTFVADNLDFEGDTPTLAPDSSAAITDLATILKSFRTAKVKIVGHPDQAGDPAQARKLAMDRATAVRDALVKAGVPADRVIAEGPASDQPISVTEAGRPKNRPIDLMIVSR